MKISFCTYYLVLYFPCLELSKFYDSKLFSFQNNQSMASSNKRAETHGFSRENMPDRLAHIQKHSASWRKVDSRKVVMTTLHQIWTHTSGVSTTVYHICPWGMKDIMTRLLGHKRCLNKNVIPKQVKDDHPLLTEDYNSKEWVITIANSGAEKPTSYHRLYCNHCQNHLIPRLTEDFKDGLGPAANIDTIIASWDSLKIPDKYMDYVGCFLPWEPKKHAGPNARKFIRDQSEHPKVSHIYTVSANPSKKKLKRQMGIVSSSSSTPPSKLLALSPPEKIPTPSSQSTIVAKFTKKTMRQGNMKDYASSIPLIGEAVKMCHISAKGLCLHIVHKGVNKCLSHEATLDMYDGVHEGQTLYYDDAVEYLKNDHPSAQIPPVV